ncbi:general substrate transporter [Aspergillus varians]
MFVIGKFIVGFGGAIGATATAPLLAELAYPTHRPIFTAVYNTTWYVGSIVAAWVTYGTFKMPNSWSWRIPSILQGVVSVIQLTCIYLVPESPRWLIANNQAETATRILCKYHAGTEEPNDLVRFEVAEITAALQFERAQRSTSYLQFFRTRGNRHRLLIATLLGFMIQWCGNGLISYYLALILTSIGIDDPKTQNIINGVLQIFNLMVAVMAACLVDRLGRRFLFLLSTAGMMVSFIIWTAISARNEQQNFESKSLGIGVVTMVFIFFAFYNLAMMPLPITYLVEILPYTLRAKGIAVFNFSQLSSAIFNGFVNPIAMERISWKYYIVYVCAIGLWLVVIFFGFPETRGLSLESVSRVFDDEDWQHQADEKTKPGQEASPKVQDVWIDEVSKQ